MRGTLGALIVAIVMALAALPGMASAGSANSAHLTSPLGYTLTSPDQTFTWSTGVGVTNYVLYVGRTLGSSNIYNSGVLPATQQSVTATGLPHDGSTLRVRLGSKINGVWQYNDYSFGAAQPVIADLAFPVQHQILPSGLVDFQWTDVTDGAAYKLYVGSSPGGAQYFNSGILGPLVDDQFVGGLPTDGSTVYARLWTNVGTTLNPVWYYHDYAFTASGAIIPVLTPDIAGALIGSTCLPLTLQLAWVDISATNATSVLLSAGTTGPGSTDLSANVTVSPLGVLNLSLGSVTCPAAGDSITIYARVWYEFGSIWYHDDYTFTLTGTV
jgi:hypothetical protein